jgi:hypothetical protein
MKETPEPLATAFIILAIFSLALIAIVAHLVDVAS